MRAGRSDEGWREHKCRVRSFHTAGVNKQERVETNTKQNIFLNMMGYTDFFFFFPQRTDPNSLCLSFVYLS